MTGMFNITDNGAFGSAQTRKGFWRWQTSCRCGWKSGFCRAAKEKRRIDYHMRTAHPLSDEGTV